MSQYSRTKVRPVKLDIWKMLKQNDCLCEGPFILSANLVTADLPGRSDDEVGNFSAPSLPSPFSMQREVFPIAIAYSTNCASVRTRGFSFSFQELAIIFFAVR